MCVRDRKRSAKMCSREDFPKRKPQIKKAERSKIRKIIKYEVERKQNGMKQSSPSSVPPDLLPVPAKKKNKTFQ